MTWPKRYGGGEQSAFDRYVLVEELLAAGAPVLAHWIADRQSGPLLLSYGSEAQKERFLPPICRGESFFCIGMSEPDSGSDLAATRTRGSAHRRRLAGQRHQALDHQRAPLPLHDRPGAHQQPRREARRPVAADRRPEGARA